jgi:hypothetical protein
MAEVIAKRFFPEVIISTVNGWGVNLTPPKQGVWVEVWKNESRGICSAEVYDDSQEEYAEVGLWVENGELVDYDGVFSLPEQVAEVLRGLGVKVPAMMMG